MLEPAWLTEIPPDPNPTADGHWIGYSLTDCFTDLQDDQDHDYFSDTCEYRLAEFFRPYLNFSDSDITTGHEPYWAADRKRGVARLFWAFAYYEDGGAAGTGCDYSQGACAGHYGDSEWVMLEIGYNSTTQHWELNSVTLSQHDGSDEKGYAAFEYHGPFRGYPTIYVAHGKHANYASDADCDAGGFAGYDECYTPDPQRDFFSAYRNLGSSIQHLKDCVESEGLFAGSGREECFWATTGEFRGWTGINNVENPVTPYGDHLIPLDF